MICGYCRRTASDDWVYCEKINDTVKMWHPYCSDDRRARSCPYLEGGSPARDPGEILLSKDSPVRFLGSVAGGVIKFFVIALIILVVCAYGYKFTRRFLADHGITKSEYDIQVTSAVDATDFTKYEMEFVSVDTDGKNERKVITGKFDKEGHTSVKISKGTYYLSIVKTNQCKVLLGQVDFDGITNNTTNASVDDLFFRCVLLNIPEANRAELSVNGMEPEQYLHFAVDNDTILLMSKSPIDRAEIVLTLDGTGETTVTVDMSKGSYQIIDLNDD